MAHRRAILGGGGDADDSRPLDRLFASWVGRSAKVLYLPVATAATGRAYETRLIWLRNHFAALGLGSIEMWSDLAGRSASDLMDFDALYIGNGNTFRLLQQLRTHGLDTALAEFADSGRPVYGSGSGAIVLGKDIATCAHQEGNVTNVEDTRGLALLGGFCVWCRYQPSDDARIAAFVAKHATPVLALTERGGAALDGEDFTAAGHEPAIRFAADARTEIAVGERIA